MESIADRYRNGRETLGARFSESPSAQRLGFPHSSIQVPHAHPIQRRCPSALRWGGRSSGGKDRPRANHGEGGIAVRQALGKLSASVRQTGIRRGTSVRVKQSKSQQILPNAYAIGSTTFSMRSCLRTAEESARSLIDQDLQPFGFGAPIENATGNSQPQCLRA